MTPSSGVTSIKIITIQVFYPGLCQKYLTFLLGLCQFSVFHKRICKIQFLIGRITGGVELLKAVLHGYAGGLIFMK